jgi:hypothetical protein
MRTERSLKIFTPRTATQPSEFVEERLYLARGLQGDDHPSPPFPDVGPNMSHLSRSEDRISRAKLVALLADLDYVLALDDVEPLLLLVVQVPRRSALLDVDELPHGQATVRVQGRNLEIDHPGAKDLALTPKPIRPGRDVVSRTNLRVFSRHKRSFLAADPGSP